MSQLVNKVNAVQPMLLGGGCLSIRTTIHVR